MLPYWISSKKNKAVNIPLPKYTDMPKIAQKRRLWLQFSKFHSWVRLATKNAVRIEIAALSYFHNLPYGAAMDIWIANRTKNRPKTPYKRKIIKLYKDYAKTIKAAYKAIYALKIGICHIMPGLW